MHIDDRAGAATATQHLIDGGHRRIGLIYGREAQSEAVLEHERHLGFRDAMDRAGIPLDGRLVVPGDYFDGRRRAGHQTPSRRRRPTDGRRLLLGRDGLRSDPNDGRTEIGATAARKLLSEIQGRDDRSSATVLPTELVIRGSTAGYRPAGR